MATTDTCPTCGNAHSGECSVAALKARVDALTRRVGVLDTRERMVLDELGFAEDVRPVWSTVLLNIRDLRERVKAVDEERDVAMRALAAARAAFARAFHEPSDDLPANIIAMGDEYGRADADAREYEAFMGQMLAIIGADPKAWDAADEMDKALDVARALVAERDALLTRIDATVTAAEVANAYGCRGDETPDEWAARLVRECDALRAQLADTTGRRESVVASITLDALVELQTRDGVIRVRKLVHSKADPRIADLTAKVRAGNGTAEDIAVPCDVAERVALLEALVAEKDEALAKADASIARLTWLAR